jgi:hypothetical protein
MALVPKSPQAGAAAQDALQATANDQILRLAAIQATGNQRINRTRTEWHRIICPGPFLCGFTRGMKLGEYIEVTGELHRLDHERAVMVAGERFPVTQSTYEVHVLTIRRLEVPAIGIDESAEGEGT